MKGIGTDDGLRGMALGSDALEEGRAQVHGNGAELGRSIRAELVEEGIQSLGVSAFGPPDDPAPVVVDHQGQVLVVLAPGDLVHPDAEEAVETVRVELGRHHPLARPSHRAPRHPAQPGHGGTVHPRGQPGQQVIQVAGQMRTRAGEGHGLDHHAVGGATQPPEAGSNLEPPRAEIEVSPPGIDRPGVVAPARLVRAVWAHEPTSAQGHGDHHHGRQELHGGDVDVVEAHEALECCGGAHGLTVSWFVGVEAREPWLQPVRAARTSQTAVSASNHNRIRTPAVHTRVRRARNLIATALTSPDRALRR